MPREEPTSRGAVGAAGWKARVENWSAHIRQREDQVFLILMLLIGALVGLSVMAFILLAEQRHNGVPASAKVLTRNIYLLTNKPLSNSLPVSHPTQ